MLGLIAKIKNKKFRNQRGVTLIWALVTAALLLIIVTTMTTLMIKELRTSSNIDNSIRAYMAAEAGIERGLFKKSKLTLAGALGTESFDFDANGGDGNGMIGSDSSCPANSTGYCYVFTVTDQGGWPKIVSIGKSNGVIRKIEYLEGSIGSKSKQEAYDSGDSPLLSTIEDTYAYHDIRHQNPPHVPISQNNNQSFTFSFVLYVEDISEIANHYVRIGLADNAISTIDTLPDQDTEVYLEFNGNQEGSPAGERSVRLAAENPTRGKWTSDWKNIESSPPYQVMVNGIYKVFIKYQKNTGIKAIVLGQEASASAGKCISLFLPASDPSEKIANLSKVFFAIDGAIPTPERDILYGNSTAEGMLEPSVIIRNRKFKFGVDFSQVSFR